MSHKEYPGMSRRTFLQGASALGAGTLLAKQLTAAQAAEGTMPRRVLGKTQQQVSALALGTWPCGRSETVDTAGVEALVNEALELGVNHLDTARGYSKAEEGIGRAIAKRRDQVFLTTKTFADTAAEARESFETSLRTLGTDHVDLLYLHSVGDRDVKKATASDGALGYLLKQKEQGKTRFVGISGHCRVPAFVPLIESGDIDVVLMAMNFVDRHIYGFEEKVLPVANKRGLGVCCMKVFGGMRGGFEVADGPNTGPQMGHRLQQAIRYSLGLPGVASLVIGPHTIQQLRQNVRFVKDYQPLSKTEQAELVQLGRRLSSEWGPRLGPVV